MVGESRFKLALHFQPSPVPFLSLDVSVHVGISIR